MMKYWLYNLARRFDISPVTKVPIFPFGMQSHWCGLGALFLDYKLQASSQTPAQQH